MFSSHLLDSQAVIYIEVSPPKSMQFTSLFLLGVQLAKVFIGCSCNSWNCVSLSLTYQLQYPAFNLWNVWQLKENSNIVKAHDEAWRYIPPAVDGVQWSAPPFNSVKEPQDPHV